MAGDSLQSLAVMSWAFAGRELIRGLTWKLGTNVDTEAFNTNLLQEFCPIVTKFTLISCLSSLPLPLKSTFAVFSVFLSHWTTRTSVIIIGLLLIISYFLKFHFSFSLSFQLFYLIFYLPPLFVLLFLCILSVFLTDEMSRCAVICIRQNSLLCLIIFLPPLFLSSLSSFTASCCFSHFSCRVKSCFLST